MNKYIRVLEEWRSHGTRVEKKYGKGKGEVCCVGLELEVLV